MNNSALSKRALERIRRFHEHVTAASDTCSFCNRLALEFDSIRRERDEVAEKLAEALRNASQYAYHRAICNVRLFPPDPCNCGFNQMMDCAEAALANYQAAKGEHQ